jgi:hypothetical protein
LGFTDYTADYTRPCNLLANAWNLLSSEPSTTLMHHGLAYLGWSRPLDEHHLSKAFVPDVPSRDSIKQKQKKPSEMGSAAPLLV